MILLWKCEGIFINEAASKFQRKLNFVFLVYSADLLKKSSVREGGKEVLSLLIWLVWLFPDPVLSYRWNDFLWQIE